MKKIKMTKMAILMLVVLFQISCLSHLVSAASSGDRLIASYTTTFSVNEAQANRNHNMNLAMNAINKVLLRPGEIFNWHKIVGPSGQADGYLLAPVIVDKQSVLGYGGGICQVSSTLYAATQQTTGFKILARKEHSKPTYYVPRELEATVDYPYQNFIFQNNRNTAVEIEAIYNPQGRLTINLYEISIGWKNNANGWWYRDSSDGYIANQWKLIDGNQYFFDANGYMVTGWQSIDREWYYFDANGHITTGWTPVGDRWYFFDAFGKMLTGWITNNGNWFYLDPANSGGMAVGWAFINGHWYYFDTFAGMQTGWQWLGDSWYYLNADGIMTIGWQNINGNWGYFDTNGKMVTGWQLIGGSWYYFGTNGKMVTGLQTIDDIPYYFHPNGDMAISTQTPEGYWVDEHGVCTMLSNP